jgi:Peptide N-acetyl-beta-D-glucosaminyl asparaginase amidase A
MGIVPRTGVLRAVAHLALPAICLVLAVAPARAGAAASAPIEVNYQDPITAAPPIQRPDTARCTVQLMQHDFAFSFGQPFVGAFTPPAGCPGPWSMVVMDWTGSIAGRQFDRLAAVWIGGVEVLRLTTPEPDPRGITWHVEKDVSEYSSILRQPRTVVTSLENLVDATFTGVFHITLSLTFYAADARHPAAAAPSQVVPISTGTQGPAWFTINSASQQARATLHLPTNLTRARLQVYASSHGCEEQWFTNVPDAYAQSHGAAGLCGGGAFRELQVLVDGTLAGVATPFPVIYSGGLNPFMWRPIPSVGQLDVMPYVVDLTPFVGLLTDGQPHTIAITVANNEGFWPVDGDLLLDQDPGTAATHGGLLRNTLGQQPQTRFTQTSAGGVDRLVTSVSRSWMTEGFVDTSAGRVVTRVEQEMRTVNDQRDTIVGGNVRQVVDQQQRTRTSTAVSARGETSRVDVVADHPLAMVEDFSTQTQPNGDPSFTIRSRVDVTMRSTQAGHDSGAASSRLDDHVVASALLVRDTTTGANLAADGSDSEHYVSEAGRACFDHLLEAAHGFVTEDRTRGACE